MNATLTLDKAGRIVIPKPLRDELNLAPGDSLSLKSEGEEVTLRPVRSGSRLRKKSGIWVLSTGQKFSAADSNKVLEDIREARDRDNLGNFK